MYLMTFLQKEPPAVLTQRWTSTFMDQSRTSMIISEMEKILMNGYDDEIFFTCYILLTFLDRSWNLTSGHGYLSPFDSGLTSSMESLMTTMMSTWRTHDLIQWNWEAPSSLAILSLALFKSAACWKRLQLNTQTIQHLQDSSINSSDLSKKTSPLNSVRKTWIRYLTQVELCVFEIR